MSCPKIKLNNGNEIPALGMGTMFLETSGNLQEIINNAIDAGYRLFDCAALYGNEELIGDAFRQNGIAREELFISSKLKNGHHRYDDAISECAKTMKALKTDYLDLYLIHYPCPAHGLYLEAWKALEHLYEEGYVKNIGLSNFHQNHIEDILSVCEIKPVIDQLECNPYVTIEPLRKWLTSQGIQTEAWFPIGGPSAFPNGMENPAKILREEQVIRDIAAAHNRSATQIILRWEIQSGIIPVPKAASRIHMEENMAAFEFELTNSEMNQISGLNKGFHAGPTGDENNEVWE